MSEAENTRLLVEIAHMYYDDQLTQQQIAKRLNMSRSLVSKLLTKAKELGIVEITIRDEGLHPYRTLENQMKRLFGLRDVVLVDTSRSQFAKKRIAVDAGRYLARKLSKARYVAVSAGRVTKEIAVKFTSSALFPNVTFVPMSGGLGEERWEVQANTVCEYFAHNCGASSMQLHAPIVVDSSEARKVLMKQHFIKDVLEKARNADVAVVGIGSSLQYFELTESYLHGLDKNDEQFKGIIKGDISYNYFDERGKLIDCHWNRQLMSISLDELREIPEVICVAEELEKAESIYIAIKEKLIDTLITDVEVAKKTLWFHERNLS